MAEAAPRLGFHSVLRNRQYLLWLASANVASVGYSVYAISVVWLAYVATHNYAVVGLVLFVEYATYAGTFLIAPFADRVANQRTIYLICYPLQAFAAGILGIATYQGFLTLPLLLGLILGISVLWDLSWAAYQAAPRLLLTPTELLAGSGVGSALGGANSIAGYALGGVLIVFVGAAGGMYLYAALLALGAVLALPLAIHPDPSSDEGFIESFRTGWRALSLEPGHSLLQLVPIDAVRAFVTTSGVALFITLIAASTFSTSGSAYAILFTTYVVGGVVAGLVLGWLNPRGRVGAVMVGSLAVSGLAFVFAGFVPPLLAFSAAAWLLVGIALTGYNNSKSAYVRGSVKPNQLARVTSNMYLFSGITSAVGALVLGTLANDLAPYAFGVVLGSGLLAAALLAFLLPSVKVLRY